MSGLSLAYARVVMVEMMLRFYGLMLFSFSSSAGDLSDAIASEPNRKKEGWKLHKFSLCYNGVMVESSPETPLVFTSLLCPQATSSWN